jgi:hypothetical protein
MLGYRQMFVVGLAYHRDYLPLSGSARLSKHTLYNKRPESHALQPWPQVSMDLSAHNNVSCTTEDVYTIKY